MATALPIIAAVAAGVQAAGTIASGMSVNAQAKNQAAQLEQNAGQARATSQRQAIQEQRQAGLAQSRGQAVAASSGAGASDPTVETIQDNIAGQGEYNSLAQLYSGEERARGLETDAADARLQGKQAQTSSYFKAGSTILSAGSSLYSKYASASDDTSGSLPWLKGVRNGSLTPNSSATYGWG